MGRINLIKWTHLPDRTNLVKKVRRTRVAREAQKMMKMFQKTGGKGLGKLFG